MTGMLVFTTFVSAVIAAFAVTAVLYFRRLEHIRQHRMGRHHLDALRRRHPQLSAKDAELVARGLQQFFIAALRGNGRPVSMPSQVADDLWHEFILDTRAYEAFCRRAFGRTLHHTPAMVLGSERASNAGLRRVWWHTCREEGIDPSRPTRLPLLFALDGKLEIAGGFLYQPDCSGFRRGAGTAVQAHDAGLRVGVGVVHCGGDFSDASFDGTTDGFGDRSGSGSDGDGDGGGGGGD